jgi:hypothetical protein
MIFVFGAPRSGTSWLAKIFDSHPDVLYRHEPDSERKHPDIPFLCTNEKAEELLPVAGPYLRSLVHVRTLKSAGSLPAFPKAYCTGPCALVRRGWIYGARVAEKIVGKRSWITVPDFTRASRRDATRFVMKSVDSMGRLNLFARAVPEAKIVVVLRHPCGQVDSVMRGLRSGYLAQAAILAMARMEQAKRRGLDEDALRAMTLEQQLAWNWGLLNEKALEDVEGRANVLVLRYEDLCTDPLGVAQRMFEFAELSWSESTARFLDVSSTYSGSERYFQVVRNSRRAAEKWREQLKDAQIAQILDVASQTLPGRLYEPDAAVAPAGRI